MKSFSTKFSLTFVIMIGFFLSLRPVSAQEVILADLDSRIQASMKDWGIPGMAVAVVKDGQIVYARGFGEKKLGEGERVDEHTLFGIASVSKNITAAALGMLVDEGKISWDTRIVDVIPWFELSDPWITSQVTVRDALTHQVGLGRMIGNRLQFLSGQSRDELIRNLRFMEFQDAFRGSYVYSNMMYSVAGQVIEYASGLTWDEFLKQRIFDPIGMSSNTSVTSITSGTNAAWPHQHIEGEVIAIARRNWDNAGPAGGINASVTDVAKWMILQLDEPGVYQGQRLISARQMAEIHRPQVVRSSSGNPYGSQLTYGLGWNILDYRGARVLTHGGATDGFNTAAYMMPEHNVGVIVVGNAFNQLGDAVAYTVMDKYLDAAAGTSGEAAAGGASSAFGSSSSTDHIQRYFNGYQRSYAAASQAREAIHAARKVGTQPSLSAAAHVGRYFHPAYESVEVRQGANGLEIRLWDNDEVVADLEHWHYDTYRAVWRNRAQREEFLRFSLGQDGEVEAVTIEFALRPQLLQVGAYPSNYTREVRFERVDGGVE